MALKKDTVKYVRYCKRCEQETRFLADVKRGRKKIRIQCPECLRKLMLWVSQGEWQILIDRMANKEAKKLGGYQHYCAGCRRTSVFFYNPPKGLTLLRVACARCGLPEVIRLSAEDLRNYL